MRILAIRAAVEGLTIDEESLSYLGEMGEKTSLRHAVQLLTPAQMLATTNGREEIALGDLEEIGALSALFPLPALPDASLSLNPESGLTREVENALAFKQPT